MRRFARWLAAGCFTLCAALPSPAATIWVATTGADNRCSASLTTACPTANVVCGHCSNNAGLVCAGNASCGGGGATCIADPALGTCRNNNCGTSSSLACKTIERGIAQTTPPDDIVRVLAGTYHECIGVLQPITNLAILADAFETSQDRTTTVIDGTGICDGTGGIFRAAVQLGDNSSFKGFTVHGGGDAGVRGFGSVVITQNIVSGNTSGLLGLGGGILGYSPDFYPSSSTLRIENNDVTGNSAPDGGGGIYILAKSRAGRRRPINIANNNVRNNTTSEGKATGAGILVRTVGSAGGDIPIVVTQNTVEGNSNLVSNVNNVLASYGGGIAVLSYSLGLHTIDITGNTVRNNNAAGLGGGISMLTDGAAGSTHHITASGNTVESNTALDPAGADGFGGGIWCEAFGYGTETIDITGNTVRSNSSGRDGGGIAAWAYPAVTVSGSQKVTVASNTVTANQAASSGGGVQVFLVGSNLPSTAVGEVTARDNTITDNSITQPLGQAGGLYAIHESAATSAPGLKLTVTRNTIKGNSATLAGGGAVVWIDADSDPEADGTQSVTAASVQFNHNLLIGNHAIDPVDQLAAGGGFFTLLQATGTATSTLQMDFNTVFGNNSDFGSGGIEIESQTDFDVLHSDEGKAVLQVSNSIVAGNIGTGVGGPTPGDIGTISIGGTGNIDVTAFSFNDVFGNNPGGNYDAWFGDRTGLLGNVSVDPQLNASGVPVAAGGLPVQCSGSVDRADPAAAFSAEPSPNGKRANLGHLGNTAGATTSLADVNGDFAVDGVDVLRIATSFASSTGQPRFLSAADLDGDGQIDGDDLAFVATQFGTSCH